MSETRVIAPAAEANGTLLATDKLVKQYRQRRVVNGVSIRSAPAKSSACSVRTARARPPPSTWSSAW